MCSYHDCDCFGRNVVGHPVLYKVYVLPRREVCITPVTTFGDGRILKKKLKVYRAFRHAYRAKS